MERTPNMQTPVTGVSDPRHCIQKVRQYVGQPLHHAREDIDKVDDPRARYLLDATAEVRSGLDHAYQHFEEEVGEGTVGRKAERRE